MVCYAVIGNIPARSEKGSVLYTPMGHSPIPFPSKKSGEKSWLSNLYIYYNRKDKARIYIYVYITDIEISSSPCSCLHMNKLFMMFSIKFARTKNCERNLILTTNFVKEKKENDKVLSEKMNKAKFTFIFDPTLNHLELPSACLPVPYFLEIKRVV